MIFGVKVDPNPLMDKFVYEFNNPSLGKEVIINSIYLEHRAERIDGLIVFRRIGAYDSFFRYGILLSLGMVLFAVIMHIYWLMVLGFISLFIFAATLSPLIFFLSLYFRLLFQGNRYSLRLVSNNMLLEVLLHERDVSSGIHEAHP